VSEREERWSKRLDVPVLVAAAAVIPVIVLEQTNVSDGWKTLGTVLNWAIWTVFVVELVVMLSVTDSRSRWLREHPLELAIVVLTPAVPGRLDAPSCSVSAA
jgi:hypothetical protein